MNALALLAIDIPTEALQSLGEQAGNTAEKAAETALQFAGNPAVLLGGIGLVVAAVLVFFFLKKIVVNTILGVIGWAIVLFVLKIELPLLPSLAISVIFGLGGIGVMLVLRFFGMI